MRYDVAIIGGGLAGSSAAIQLARRGASVLLLEKKRYPVHKLCGEFLSPEVAASFQRLGVLEAVRGAGARPVRSVLATTSFGACFEAPLPGGALSLSRYRLDRLLFERAREEGAEAHEGVAVRDVKGSFEDGFVLHTHDATFKARTVLGAWGKRGLLDRKVGRDMDEHRSPHVAFKAHYAGPALPETIELHAFRGGYCGLVQVEGGRINACWISHTDVLREAGTDPEAMVEKTFTENEHLNARFRAMERLTDSFCAVSQISVTQKPLFERDVCMIGDTAGMIAPMCGDGMAMALHSAELVVPCVQTYLDGRSSKEMFRRAYETAWQNAFASRMRIGRWVHRAYMRPLSAEIGVRFCSLVPAAGRWVIQRTRGLSTL